MRIQNGGTTLKTAVIQLALHRCCTTYRSCESL